MIATTHQTGNDTRLTHAKSWLRIPQLGIRLEVPARLIVGHSTGSDRCTPHFFVRDPLVHKGLDAERFYHSHLNPQQNGYVPREAALEQLVTHLQKTYGGRVRNIQQKTPVPTILAYKREKDPCNTR